MILSIASIPDELLHMINQKTHEEITVCDYNTNKEEALKLKCTPFVRQYDILNNKWGDFLCQKE